MMKLVNGSHENYSWKIWMVLISAALFIAAISVVPSNAKLNNPSLGDIEKAYISTSGTNAPVKDLPAAAWQRIQQKIDADIYAVRGPQNRSNGGSAQHWVKNPAMGYVVSFSPDQVLFKDTRSDLSAWAFSMQLAAYGYRDHLRPVAPAKIGSEQNRISYKRGELEEWYINTPEGVEQGFTLDTPPGNQGSASLLFDIAVAGDLQPRLSADGSQISLYNLDGQCVLTYSKLKVVDANGKVLHSEMKAMAATSDGKNPRILLEVDDAHAAYPIIVDPSIQTAVLTAFDGAAADRFGESVAISVDTVAVGAPEDDDGGFNSSGSVYLFGRNEGGANNWGLITKLTASDPAASDGFGHIVAISGDTLVVGAPFDNDVSNTIGEVGSVYIFERNQGGADNWGEALKLLNDDPTQDDQFGFYVAISADTLVVGTPYDDDLTNGDDSGSAYIFERNLGGAENWGQAAKVIASDGETLALYGDSVAISGDTVVVGTPDANESGGSRVKIGAAYVYERDLGGADVWGEATKLISSDPDSFAYFGYFVAISGDTIAVGTPDDDDTNIGANTGSVYLFERNEGGLDNWGLVKNLTSATPAVGDRFGYSVSISGDNLVVGARHRDDVATNAGAAYVFKRNEGGAENWGQFAKIVNNNGAADDEFGFAVSVSGDSVATGSPLNDTGDGADAGSAYIYSLSNFGFIINPIGGMTTTEAGGSASFTVALYSQPTDDVTIGLTSSDTGEGTVSPASLTFTNGDWNSAQTVTVTGVDDIIGDGDQAYQIVTAAAVSVDGNYDGLNPDNAFLINQDDDAVAGVTVDPTSGLTTTEAGGSATFTVVLDAEPTDDVTIDLTSNTIGEGTVSPASLTFDTLNWNSAQTVTVTGVDDAVDDGDVFYNIITADCVSTDGDYNGLVVADVSLTNQDNDTAGVTVDPTGGLTTTEDGGTATFTVVLNTAPTADVTIDLASNDTGEGTVLPASLTFTSVNWNAAQTVTVTGVDDVVDDGDTAYAITTAAAVSSDTVYNGIDPDNVTLSNQDNDTIGFTVSPTSGLTTTEGGGSATFTVVLNTMPTEDVTIDLISDNTDEGSVSPAFLIFTSSDWNSAQTVTVTGVDDDIDDGDQAYTINTSAAMSSDSDYDGLDPDNVSLTNQDNDTAGVTVDPTGSLITTEAGDSATFTVVLNTMPTADVTIDLTSDNTDEGTVSPASLTFTSANWDTPQTVTVTGVDDTADDGDQDFSVNTSACVSTDAGYDGVEPDDVSLTNEDDEGSSGGGGGGGSGGGCFISSFGE